MKKFALQTMALVLFVSTAFTSCSSDDSGDTLTLQKEFVTAVTGPTTGAVNEDITLTVTYAVDNSCGQFNKYVQTVNGNTKTIEVEAKYVGTDCGTTPATKTEPYKFKVIQAGTYVFKFKKSATEFITQTVVVE